MAGHAAEVALRLNRKLCYNVSSANISSLKYVFGIPVSILILKPCL